ncbi:DJ-1/PfpI family protein [Dethiosulfatarculus sandiegensis]|uniref:AraC family transcriptional regulator n=1 Tax=Dethiosulfatarculus sandiegensis TaxID=1429043 RepID=A0A0D2JEW1_9BACT|nr:DJ-1/PfpI family protein [Dethiosulfatarculus sandiegensis]KIX14211.1 AraC family transcriptional regulator [Dethiosulfatarculus sandiegensis]
MERLVSILLFEGIELLDFSGPFEVFSACNKSRGKELFSINTVADSKLPLKTANGLKVMADFDFLDCPQPDILVVPGGQGARKAMQHSATLDFVASTTEKAEFCLSICTGALILACAGLLENQKATTFHGAFDLLASVAPRTRLLPGVRFVDNGRIITSAGIAAGMDATLYLIGKILDHKAAREAAEYMEYPWQPQRP